MCTNLLIKFEIFCGKSNGNLVLNRGVHNFCFKVKYLLIAVDWLLRLNTLWENLGWELFLNNYMPSLVIFKLDKV